MFSVIIADDEPLIIKGLLKMVDWQRLDAKVIATARNGEQLINHMEELSPDIIISDISMPGKSGIDVIRYIEEHHLKSKVIFLSAYQEFEYAKQAVHYGVTDYLLKPVSQEELEGAIIKAEQACEDKLFLGCHQEDKKSTQVVMGNENETIRNIKRYIRENFAQDINLKLLSGQFYMNQYYFSTFFKQKTGKNFKDYLVEVRMLKAMELLQNDSGISTQTLANKVGYHDVRTFSEKFKQYYGESPVNYKRINHI